MLLYMTKAREDFVQLTTSVACDGCATCKCVDVQRLGFPVPPSVSRENSSTAFLFAARIESPSSDSGKTSAENPILSPRSLDHR